MVSYIWPVGWWGHQVVNFLFVFFWGDKFLLYSPGWPWTQDSSASVSPVLGLQMCVTTVGWWSTFREISCQEVCLVLSLTSRYYSLVEGRNGNSHDSSSWSMFRVLELRKKGRATLANWVVKDKWKYHKWVSEGGKSMCKATGLWKMQFH
jgi:hypothetical protein